jgi:hypothetical protein
MNHQNRSIDQNLSLSQSILTIFSVNALPEIIPRRYPLKVGKLEKDIEHLETNYAVLLAGHSFDCLIDVTAAVSKHDNSEDGVVDTIPICSVVVARCNIDGCKVSFLEYPLPPQQLQAASNSSRKSKY